MTRKTFVKKMMGMGYSRNEANAMADRARRYGMSYAHRWEWEMDFRVSPAVEFITGLAQGLRETIPGVVEAVSKLAADAVAAAKEIAEKVRPIFQHIVKIYDVSLVPSGGVPLNYGQNCDGLRTNVVLADELAASDPALTHEEIEATTAKWPGTTVMVGVDLANGPDMAAEIHVAGGAANGD